MKNTPKKNKELLKAERKQYVKGLALISSYVIIFVLFTIVPFVMGVTMSFMSYNPSNTSGNKFVGLQNYINLFNFENVISLEYWTSFGTMLLFLVVTVPFLIIIPFCLAYLINLNPPGYKVMRAIIYLPSVISITVIGTVFVRIFAGDEYGLVNAILIKIGAIGEDGCIKWLNGLPFAGDFLRWVVMFIVSIWWQTGTNFVIFSGALKDVPKPLLEACEMDGGGLGRKLSTVILPCVRPSINICLFNTLIGYLALYGQPSVLHAGMENSGEIVSPMMFIYKWLNTPKITGYVCASAVIFGLVTVILSSLEKKLMADRRKVTRYAEEYHAFRVIADNESEVVTTFVSED